MAGLASCDESDYEYTKPSAVSGPQVYFATTNPSAVELDSKQGTFVLPIERVDSTSEITVPLTVASTFDGYTIPESVTFEAGKKTADISVSYTGLEYDLMDTITISLPEDMSTPYGSSNYTVVVGCPAPWTPWCNSKDEWTEAGMSAEDWPLSDDASVTCTYTYANYWSGDDPGLKIYYRQSTIDATQAQFKIEHWGSDMDFIVEYNPETSMCQVLEQYVMDNSTYGPLYISDIPNYSTKYTYQQYPCYYDKAAGKFTLNTVWFVEAGAFGFGPEYIQVDGFYIPDYSISVGYEGILTVSSGEVFALLNVTEMGPDVTSAKAAIVDKDDDESAVADALAAGDLEGGDLVLGNNKLALGDMTGELKVVAVTIADDEAKSVKAFNFSYYGGGDANPWKSIGKGTFSDDILAPMFGLEPQVYEVDIRENAETPGVYRIMNPYGSGVYPIYDNLVQSDYTMPTSEMYLEVNASDPDAVYVEHQSLGIDLGDGVLGFVTYGASLLGDYEFGTVKENGMFGTLKDGVITFPAFYYDDEQTKYFQGYITQGGSISYYCGRNGAIEITLPSAEEPKGMKARVAGKRNFAGSLRLNNAAKVGSGKRLLPLSPKASL